MKTMKFYVMMLMAAVMTFGLTACGGDNNDGGSGAAPDYIGIWVMTDTQSDFTYVELTVDAWKNVEYHHVRNSNEIRKNIVTGGLSVNGNQVHLTGGAPFTTATYSVSGNTMTLQFVENGRSQTIRVERISSADAAAKVAAWEALYIASQNNQNNH